MRHAWLWSAAICLGACGTDEPHVPTDVQVRACNASAYNFATLSLQLPSDSSGRLAAGQCNAYRDAAADYVFRYTYVKLTIGSETIELSPIDYVGETPLTAGHWSYQITVTDPASHYADVRATADD